ncbi:MAG: MFS transporter [Deltaproteobacteria bacterium]|nr:MFS transporter [Deltaproteobacteria bacterium]
MNADLKIFITLFLAVFNTTLGVGLVAPLLPLYAHELGAGAFQIGLIFGAFSLTRSIFVPYFGKLSDRKGKKPLITTGLFAYFILSLCFTASGSVEALVAIRLGQGFASAMILPVAQAYVGLITPLGKEGQVMGLFNMSLFAGLSLGPLLGGVVKDWFSIQVSFLCMAALTLLGFFLCLFLLPGENDPDRAATGHQAPAPRYTSLLASPSILCLFIFRTCLTLCIGIAWTFIPFLAGVKLGISSSSIGVIVMVNVLIAGLLQAPMGYLADRVSKVSMVVFGGFLAVFSILYLDSAASFGKLMLANGLFGLAGGISFPAIMALGIIEGRRRGAMGTVMGLLALAHSLGMLLGPLLAGLLIDLFSFSVVSASGAAVLTAGTLLFLGGALKYGRADRVYRS